MIQAAILVTGALAILLTQMSPDAAHYACLVGLIGQPFWLRATWRARQWGMWALSVFYTGAWLLGVWLNWVAPWFQQ
jgi:hypothetical protein